MTIALQRCAACGTVNYPPREICRNCLGEDLPLTQVSGRGEMLALSLLHTSAEPEFRARLPWPIGSARLDCGAVIIVHRRAGVTEIGQHVELAAETLDGRTVFFAHPVTQP